MEDYKEIVNEQLAMNEITWQKLIQNGLTSNSEVQLDFSYFATSKGNVEALRNFLNNETDYDVLIKIFNDTVWCLDGKTQKTTISLETLNQWVKWMVLAGQEYECKFDG